jgi:hypothetical protein
MYLDACVRYAFARANGEVWDEYLRRAEKINEEMKNSTTSRQEKKEKMTKLREGLGPHLFNFFDMHQCWN